MKNKYFLQVLLVFSVLAVLAVGYFAQSSRAQAAGLFGRIQALHDTDGKSTAEYLKPQRPTLVKFWASWCPLCLAGLGETESWRLDGSFQGANIVSIASPDYLGEMPPAAFVAWYGGLNYPTLPVLTDNGGQIARDAGIAVYPSWALFDEHGRLQRIVKGDLNRPQALALLRHPQADPTTQEYQK